jgi:hypothetical protein
MTIGVDCRSPGRSELDAGPVTLAFQDRKFWESGAAAEALWRTCLAVQVGWGVAGREHRGPTTSCLLAARVRNWKFLLACMRARGLKLNVHTHSLFKPGLLV